MTFALVLWDLVGRNPLQIVRDVGRAVKNWATLLRAFARFAIGLIFGLFALLLVATVFMEPHAFSIVASGIVVAALAVDALVGDALRAGIGLHR